MIFQRKALSRILFKLLPIALLAAVAITGCGRRVPRSTDKPDPVLLAERTKTERAISEKEDAKGTDDSEIKIPRVDQELTLDYIVMEVNGEPTTYREVQEEVGKILQEAGVAKVSEREMQVLFARSLQRILARKLVLAEAKEMGFSIAEARLLAEVRSRIPEINEKYGGDIERYLEAKDLDYTAFMQGMRNDMLYDAYIQMNILPKVVVSPKEIREYYEDHRNDFKVEAGAHLFAITLFYDAQNADNLAEVKAKAEDICKKLKEGADFEKTATDNSQDPEKRKTGGDWGWVSAKDFPAEELKDAINDLEVGAISDPITTGVAVWIVKIAGRRQAKMKTLEEAWADIESTIRRDRINVIMAKELEKLRQKHKVIMHIGGPERSDASEAGE